MEQTVIPQLRMTDSEKTVSFYTARLGFLVDWVHQFEPNFPLFVQLTRQGQTIFISGHSGDCQIGGAVYFKVPDVDACFQEFSSRGLSVAPPENTPWKTRELVVIDPDGNKLRFATHVA